MHRTDVLLASDTKHLLRGDIEAALVGLQCRLSVAVEGDLVVNRFGGPFTLILALLTLRVAT